MCDTESNMTAQKTALPCVAVLLTTLLAYPFLLKPEKSRCAMTYMYPSYFDVSSIARAGGTYHLYLYREGRAFFPNASKAPKHLLAAVMVPGIVNQKRCLDLQRKLWSSPLVRQPSFCMAAAAATNRCLSSVLRKALHSICATAACGT